MALGLVGLVAKLTLLLLGAPTILLDDEPVQLDRRAALALLSYLALTRRPHSREALATLLAGDATPEAARKRLRNALTNLNEHGLAPFLAVDRQQVGLQPSASISLDVDRLDMLGSVSDAHDLAWVSDICDRELLAGLSMDDAPEFEEWLTREREHRRNQITTLVERYVEQLIWAGRNVDGIALARRLLAVEPWRETTHRQLIRLLARDGQLSAARAQVERCQNALAEELGIEPDAETLALAEQLHTGPITIRHNLPSPMGEDWLVGSETAIATAITHILDPSCRLLSLTGLGGIGKTSVALAAAQSIAAPSWLTEQLGFRNGIFFIDLRESSDTASDTREPAASQRLLAAIGLALGVVFYGRIDPLDQLVAYLESRRVLLVIDNLETLADGAGVLEDLLQRSVGVKVVVTTPEPLGLPQEHVIELKPLPVPATSDDVPSAPASQLLLRDAGRVGARIAESDWPDVVRVCRLTGGLPLAVKIAASALSTLTLPEVVAELATGKTLFDEPIDIRSSRSSMRSVVQAGMDALPTPERTALIRLAVFPATFNRDAAEAIGLSFGHLLALCKRSLVERDDAGRYDLHPVVRRVAAAELDERPEDARRARALHAAHFAELVTRIMPEFEHSRDGYETMSLEHANNRAAWDWGVAEGDVSLLEQLLDGLDSWCQRAGQHSTWATGVAAAISRLQDESADPRAGALLTRLHIASADGLLWHGEIETGLAHLREARVLAAPYDDLALDARISLAEGRLLRFRAGQAIETDETLQKARILARATQQPRIEAASLLAMSYAAHDNEEYRLSESYLRRAAAVFATIGDRHSLARTTLQQGRLGIVFGDFAGAQTHLEQSLSLAESFGDRFVEATSHVHLGIIDDVAHGHHRQADAHFDQAALIARLTGDPYLKGIVRRGQGRNAMRVGDFDRAKQYFGEALDIARTLDNTRALGDSVCCLAQLAIASGQDRVAIEQGQQALLLARDTGRRHAGASALLVLGRAHERLGSDVEAMSEYSQAVAIAEMLDLPYLMCDAMTGLASAAGSMGSTTLASRVARRVADYLLEHQLAGCEEPGWNTVVAYRALSGRDDERAADVLRMGGRLIAQRIAELPSGAARRYVDAYPERSVLLQLSGDSRLHKAAPSHLTIMPPAGMLADALERRKDG